MSWDVRHLTGPVSHLHAVDPDELGPARRTVLVMHPDAPAVVLGSTQGDDVVDHEVAERGGFDVVRRHSGGGLVLVVPDEMLWVDVVIPAHDPLWQADVGAAFDWLGEVWADALGADRSTALHLAPPLRADLGRVVCFAGVGRGEVVVDGRKVVGLSQRRTRAWARFQCMVHTRFDVATTLDVVSATHRRGAVGERLEAALSDRVGEVSDAATVAGRLLSLLGDR